MENTTQKCGNCRKIKQRSPDHFKPVIGPTGIEFQKTCTLCMDAIRARTEKKRAASAENSSAPAASNSGPEDDDDASDFLGLEEIGLDAFLEVLGTMSAKKDQNKGSLLISAFVDLNGLDGDIEERVNLLRLAIWDQTFYRWTLKKRYHAKSTGVTRYVFNCAQNAKCRQRSEKTSGPDIKRRDKGSLSTFPCEGWLTVWATGDSTSVFIRIRHALPHVHYTSVTIPDDVREYVKENKDRRVADLWKEIIKKNRNPDFSQKSIYNLWLKYSQQEWKRDDDEVKSARILLEEFKNQPAGGPYCIEPIPLPDQDDGFTALAFSLPNMLRKWGGTIREVALDSAWNTNHSRFEIYALLGEVYGSGCPLGYLLIQSKDGLEGEKEKYIRKLLAHFRVTWEMRILETLSDKDMTEINAFIAELPAKHQLCFWHCLRAIKTRLATIARHPAPYKAQEAFDEFDWIDRNFVPVKQMAPGDAANVTVAQQSIPSIKLRLGGQDVNGAPERPRLIIRVNGALENIDRDMDEGVEEEGDLDEYLDGLDDADLEAQDQEDGPDWLFEPGELSDSVFGQSKTYVFCPAPHRARLLHIFTKHFCEHPLLPDRLGSTRSAAQIRADAVHEMYTFCFQRGLREVWGYMWTSWYSARKWDLWARSTAAYLFRLRTTMTVESFWRYLKHETLHHLLHPRLDQLIWLLVTDVGPRFEAKMAKLDAHYRAGRSNELSPLQKALKANWMKLQSRAVPDIARYTIDVASWTCNCGQQKYNPYCLCKHLVHSVLEPDPRFFREVVRRRTIPFYRHPLLIPKAGEPLPALEFGSIDEGDDRPLVDTTQVLGKRRREAETSDRSTRAWPLASGREDEPIEISGSSSPLPIDEIDYLEERADIVKGLQERARQMREASRLLEEQIKLGSHIWLKSMASRDIGADAAQMVKDIQKHVQTGRKRETTWAKKGDRKSARFTSNTMGYQIPLEQVSEDEVEADGAILGGSSSDMEGFALDNAIEVD